MPLKKETNGDYSKAVVKLLENINKKISLSKDGLKYIVSILELINEDLIDITRKESGKTNEINCICAEAAVRQFPKKIADCALSEGNKALLKLDQNELIYKGPAKPRTQALRKIKPEMFKKGLIELAAETHPNCELTDQATKLGCSLIYNLAQTFVSRAILEIGDESEMTVDHMISSVRFTMSYELIELANLHGHKMLDFYSKGLLEFDVRPRTSSLTADGSSNRQTRSFDEGCLKIAEQYGVSLDNNAIEKLDSILNKLASRISANAAAIAIDSSRENVTGTEAFQAVQLIFPEEMFANADNNGRMNVFNYVCGHLKYSRPSQSKLKTAKSKTVSKQKHPTSINFRTGIKTNAPHVVFVKSSIGHLNNILNDVCKRLIAECVALCNSSNRRVMTRYEVLETACRIFPGELRNHALAHLKSVEMGLKRIEEEQGSQLPHSLVSDGSNSMDLGKGYWSDLGISSSVQDQSASEDESYRGNMTNDGVYASSDEDYILDVSHPNYWTDSRPYEFLPEQTSNEGNYGNDSEET